MVETTDITELKALILSLQAENTTLKATIAQLQARLNQNSTNSRKPPATDGLAKKAVIKPAFNNQTDRKVGGQKGHPGKTLRFVELPHTICQHCPDHCQECGLLLTDTPTLIEGRQVFDLPAPKLLVEEHQLLQRRCSCGCLQRGNFPALVNAPVQYGPRIHAQSILLNIDYKLPFAKVTRLWADVTGYSYNPATLTQAQAMLSARLVPIETTIKADLEAAPVCHFDETGIRVGGKLHWLHVACTSLYTYLFIHPNRGQTALKSPQSIFENCTNWLVHDCWSSYFAAGKGRHALCGAHLLRELAGQLEAGRDWAKPLSDYLLALYQVSPHGPLPANERRSWLEAYRHLCQQGLSQEPPPLLFYNKAGQARNKRPKQSKGRNLLNRLVAHEGAVLAFAFEAGVPFTNNEAERSLRPAKIKQKVSGGFRTEVGAARYARLTGFIATMRKQEHNVVEQVANVIKGQFQWATT